MCLDVCDLGVQSNITLMSKDSLRLKRWQDIQGGRHSKGIGKMVEMRTGSVCVCTRAHAHVCVVRSASPGTLSSLFSDCIRRIKQWDPPDMMRGPKHVLKGQLDPEVVKVTQTHCLSYLSHPCSHLSPLHCAPLSQVKLHMRLSKLSLYSPLLHKNQEGIKTSLKERLRVPTWDLVYPEWLACARILTVTK